MTVVNRYFLTALPPLPEPGQPVGITVAELLERVADRPSARQRVETVLLMRDLSLWQQALSGSRPRIEPVVLTPEQINGVAPLPDSLAGERAEANAPRNVVDAVWERYVRYVSDVARALQSTFLDEWIGFEVALRNAVATERSRILEIEAAPYLIAADLERADGDLTDVIANWLSTGDPLAGERAGDTWRLTWLDAHDAAFTFSDDEFAAYAARLVILERWENILTEAENPVAVP